MTRIVDQADQILDRGMIPPPPQAVVHKKSPGQIGLSVKTDIFTLVSCLIYLHNIC